MPSATHDSPRLDPAAERFYAANEPHARKGALDEFSNAQVMGFLKHENATIRAMAACVLGTRRNGESAASLGEALSDESWLVREFAAGALKELGAKARPAIVSLENAMRSTLPEDSGMILNAAEALASANDAGGFQALSRIYHETSNEETRDSVVYALRHCEAPANAKGIVPIFKREHDRLRLIDEEKANLVSAALSQLGWDATSKRWHDWYTVAEEAEKKLARLVGKFVEFTDDGRLCIGFLKGVRRGMSTIVELQSGAASDDAPRAITGNVAVDYTGDRPRLR